ncbi:hypothetical protein PRZ48_002473 [Zasmidium cellare]|uniref:Uncharacterized protein n=1 Tax=Zasmidium cellare TaxID=395010 RepID=A0ABR0F455_ZASCE|nr:hypothetical protein PRZ48_002473 [Zasmidium cellare]
MERPIEHVDFGYLIGLCAIYTCARNWRIARHHVPPWLITLGCILYVLSFAQLFKFRLWLLYRAISSHTWDIVFWAGAVTCLGLAWRWRALDWIWEVGVNVWHGIYLFLWIYLVHCPRAWMRGKLARADEAEVAEPGEPAPPPKQTAPTPQETSESAQDPPPATAPLVTTPLAPAFDTSITYGEYVEQLPSQLLWQIHHKRKSLREATACESDMPHSPAQNIAQMFQQTLRPRRRKQNARAMVTNRRRRQPELATREKEVQGSSREEAREAIDSETR